MTKQLHFLLLGVLLGFSAQSQDIQGSLKKGISRSEAILTIKNNSAAPIVGNVTRVRFATIFYSDFGGYFEFSNFRAVPQPNIGSATFMQSTHFSQPVYSVIWDGSMPVDLDPGEEIDFFAFNVISNGIYHYKPHPDWGLVLWYGDPSYEGSEFAWDVIIDDENRTKPGYNRFYAREDTKILYNEEYVSGVMLNTFTYENLPVKLTYFAASPERNKIHLDWSTSEEVNSEYFEIQHSLNVRDWHPIGIVRSAGDSKILKNYTFTDENPGNGTNYYRLKMVDLDKTFTYSKIVEAKSSLNTNIIFPNPVSDKLLLENSIFNSLSKYQIFDVSGKLLVESVEVGEDGIDVKDLTPGLFVIKIVRSNGGIENHRFLKK